MRRKVLVPLLALCGLALLGFFFLGKHRAGNPPENLPTESAPDPAKTDLARDATSPNIATPGSPAASVANPGSDALTNHEAYVVRRVAELQDLSMENDSASLSIILSELTNRDREIRSAAIDAAVQFGSREAIPALVDAATQIEDPEQKAAIQEAINYLQLPSFSEFQIPSRARKVKTVKSLNR
jgi:hypothetical protein